MTESPFYQLTVELIIGFFALLIVIRFIRKSQINNITPFDFISAIVLGELLGNAIYDDQVKIWNVLYALALWAALMYIMELITQKIRRTRKPFEGEPAIIIRNGQIDYQVIKKEKLDLNELLSVLRQKDVFSIREIEFAILEQSGSISVLKKGPYDSPKAQDLNLPPKTVYLPVTLIMDGEVMQSHLDALGFDINWLKNQIQMFGFSNVKDIFFAEWKQDEGIHVVPRDQAKS